MPRKPKTSSKYMYDVLCKKYPHINPKEDENLNIENAVVKIIERCWYDVKTYLTVEEIAAITKITPRSIHNYAIQHNFKKRKTIKYDKQNVQSIKYS